MSMTLIEHIELDSAQGSITFTDGGAWSGYTDLLIKLTVRTTDSGTAELLRVQFNSSTSNYSAIQLFGNGSTVNSQNNASAFNAICIASAQGDGPTANTFGSIDIYIPNFASSDHKSLSAEAVVENNATSVATGITAGLWSNTDAITSITLIGQTGTTDLKVGSTFTLYGITAGSDGTTTVS